MSYLNYMSIVNKISMTIKVQKLISRRWRPWDKSQRIFRTCTGRRDGGSHSRRDTGEEHWSGIQQAQWHMQSSTGYEQYKSVKQNTDTCYNVDEFWWWSHNSANILKATVHFECIVQHGKCISVMLLIKIGPDSHFHEEGVNILFPILPVKYN